MFLLGHLGIGSRMGRPFIDRESPAAWRALFVGCVLPDFIDKPLYYGLAWATGKHGAGLGLVSSTRTFGHSLLFAALCALFVRGPRGKALFAGMVTHLLLDWLGDGAHWLGEALHLVQPEPAFGPHTISAILFPFFGPHFPILPFATVQAHAAAEISPYILGSELIGATLLLFDLRTYRRWRARRGIEPA